MSLQDLANKHAYAILTCDGSTDDIDSVLESWSEGQERDDVTVWSRFSELDPDDLLDEHTALADAFLQFHEEASEAMMTTLETITSRMETIVKFMYDAQAAQDKAVEMLQIKLTTTNPKKEG